MTALTKINFDSKMLDFLPGEISEFITNNRDYFVLEEAGNNQACLSFDRDKNHLFYYDPDFGRLFFDFDAELKYHRKKNYKLSDEILARALGIKKANHLKVLDATAGTMKDAILIYSFGASVTAYEKNPIIYLLAKDALIRSNLPITLIYGDSLLCDNFNQFDAVYFDPMYPEKKKKSALPRKEMQIFQKLLAEDLFSAELLTLKEREFILKVRDLVKDRIVVKRPLDAGPILENTSGQYLGKTTRYDMYKNFLKR